MMISVQQTHSQSTLVGELISGTRLPVRMFDHSEEVSLYVAQQVAELVRSRNVENRATVLGLPTGSTPIGVNPEIDSYAPRTIA